MTKVITPLAAELASARQSLSFFRSEVQYLAAKVKLERIDAKLAKADARRARRDAAIAKAQARLDRLLAPVGSKAVKSNRKPSKVKTIKFTAAVNKMESATA
jgi:hypothetical protein